MTVFYLHLVLAMAMMSPSTGSTTSQRNEINLKQTSGPTPFKSSKTQLTGNTDEPSKTTRLDTDIVTTSLEMNGYGMGNSTVSINNTAAQLNVVIIIMIAILAFIIIASVAGGLYVLCWKPTSKGRTPLVECPSEFDVTNPHLYQRNSIMVMFDQTTAVDGNSVTSPDADALNKVRAAFLAAGGDEGNGRGSAVPPVKTAFENIGYDKGCDA